jgi:hypothetical protein
VNPEPHRIHPIAVANFATMPSSFSRCRPVAAGEWTGPPASALAGEPSASASRQWSANRSSHDPRETASPASPVRSHGSSGPRTPIADGYQGSGFTGSRHPDGQGVTVLLVYWPCAAETQLRTEWFCPLVYSWDGGWRLDSGLAGDRGLARTDIETWLRHRLGGRDRAASRWRTGSPRPMRRRSSSRRPGVGPRWPRRRRGGRAARPSSPIAARSMERTRWHDSRLTIGAGSLRSREPSREIHATGSAPFPMPNARQAQLSSMAATRRGPLPSRNACTAAADTWYAALVPILTRGTSSAARTTEEHRSRCLTEEGQNAPSCGGKAEIVKRQSSLDLSRVRETVRVRLTARRPSGSLITRRSTSGEAPTSSRSGSRRRAGGRHRRRRFTGGRGRRLLGSAQRRFSQVTFAFSSGPGRACSLLASTGWVVTHAATASDEHTDRMERSRTPSRGSPSSVGTPRSPHPAPRSR